MIWVLVVLLMYFSRMMSMVLVLWRSQVKFQNKVSYDHKLQNHKQNYCEPQKKWFDYNKTLPQMFSLELSEILINFSE